MMILRDYQQSFYDDIQKKISGGVNKICAVATTGFGKSVIISKLAHDLPGRTLVLTHRIELLEQNSAWIEGASILTSKNNEIMLSDKVVVSMVQTLFSRVKKYGIQYIGGFDNIIIDECHVQIFSKVFEQYDFNILIGLTATALTNKKINTEVDGVEFWQDFTMSEIFDDIVVGIGEQELIELGYLTQDFNVVLRLPNIEKLKSSDSEPDGYTKQSIDEVYNNTASFKVLEDAYFKYGIGKKTIIFNANTTINLKVYEYLKDLDLNVKYFDSVNSAEINPDTDKPYTRKQIVEWFRNEKDAVLINTNVFSTGFDVDDVECIIMNRATKSLGLYLQCVGRGSRITNKIYKDKFTVIDLGENIRTHGRWSLERDWKSMFFPQPPRRKNKEDLLQTWNCTYCDAINVVGEIVCESCGKEKVVVKRGSQKKDRDGELETLDTFPIPRGKKIIAYTKVKKQDANFAFRLAQTQIIELFINYRVTAEFYNANKERFHQRVYDIFRPIYFGILSSDLKGSNKKLETQKRKLLTKIDSLYETKI